MKPTLKLAVFAAFMLLLCTTSMAQSNVIYFRFTDSQSNPQTNRYATLTGLCAVPGYNGNYVAPFPIVQLTDTNGTAWFTNVIPGYEYVLEFDLPYKSFFWTNGFPTNLTGTNNGWQYNGLQVGNFFVYFVTNYTTNGGAYTGTFFDLGNTNQIGSAALTNLAGGNASALSGGTTNLIYGVITNVTAGSGLLGSTNNATVTVTTNGAPISTNSLPPSILPSAGTNIVVTASGLTATVSVASNANGSWQGSFTGNGAGLTNVTAANLTGTVPIKNGGTGNTQGLSQGITNTTGANILTTVFLTNINNVDYLMAPLSPATMSNYLINNQITVLVPSSHGSGSGFNFPLLTTNYSAAYPTAGVYTNAQGNLETNYIQDPFAGSVFVIPAQSANSNGGSGGNINKGTLVLQADPGVPIAIGAFANGYEYDYMYMTNGVIHIHGIAPSNYDGTYDNHSRDFATFNANTATLSVSNTLNVSNIQFGVGNTNFHGAAGYSLFTNVGGVPYIDGSQISPLSSITGYNYIAQVQDTTNLSFIVANNGSGIGYSGGGASSMDIWANNTKISRSYTSGGNTFELMNGSTLAFNSETGSIGSFGGSGAGRPVNIYVKNMAVAGNGFQDGGTGATNVFNGGIIIGNSTNTPSFTLVNTNWIDGKPYTNATGRNIFAYSQCTITPGAASSIYALTVGGTIYSQLSSGTEALGTFPKITNSVQFLVTNGGVFAFTNLTGTGSIVAGGYYEVH